MPLSPSMSTLAWDAATLAITLCSFTMAADLPTMPGQAAPPTASLTALPVASPVSKPSPLSCKSCL